MGKPCSPLRYPGGKASLKPLLYHIVQGNGLIRCHYAEPYAGGGGLALSLLYSGLVSDIHINDIDPSIWSFWYSILEHNEEFLSLIKSAKLNVEEWFRQRDVQAEEDCSDPLKLGFSAFYLNRTNRSGVIRGAGVIGGLSQNGTYKMDCRFNKDALCERIERVARYKSRIHLTNQDAIDFIVSSGSYLPKKSLFCIDPPYVKKGASLYTSFYDVSDHQVVADTVKKIKKPWLVTYDDTEIIRGCYEGFPQYGLDVRYSLHEKKMGNEILITSKKICVPEEVKSRRISFKNIDLV